MRLNKWTVIFDFKESKKMENLKFFSMGSLADVCSIIFKKDKCFILIETSIKKWEIKNHIMKICILEQAEQIASIFSWKYNISLINPSVYKGNIKKVKLYIDGITSNRDYTNFFLFEWSDRNIQILEAYREIINERSKSLKFIMSYRLIELFSKENGTSVDNFILKLFPNISTISEKRHGEKRINFLTHNRNKIHATNNKYNFPYESFERVSEEMNVNLRKILDIEFSKK